MKIFLNRIEFKDIINGTLYLRDGLYTKEPLNIGVKLDENALMTFYLYNINKNILGFAEYKMENKTVNNFIKVADLLKSFNLPVYENMELNISAPIGWSADAEKKPLNELFPKEVVYYDRSNDIIVTEAQEKGLVATPEKTSKKSRKKKSTSEEVEKVDITSEE